MPLEFVARNGIISQGNIVVSGSITSTGAITISGSIASASFAATASSADNFLTRGTLTAQTIVVQTITSSIDWVTGSAKFGSINSNAHTFTGSVAISGSNIFGLNVNAGSLYVSSSGQVGVNTATPNFGLDVNGTGRFTGALSGTSATFSSGATQFTISATSSTDTRIGIYSSGNQSAGLYFESKNAGTTVGNATIRVSNTGALQFYNGTTSDALNFSISSTGAATFSSSVSVGDYLTGQGTNPGGLGGSRYVVDFNAERTRLFSYGSNTSTNGNFLFNSQRSNGTNSVDIMYLSGGGNVGIGTTSPSQKLVVQDTTDTFIQIRNSTAGQNFFLGATSTDARLTNDNATPITFNVNGAERMRITSGGVLRLNRQATYSSMTYEETIQYHTSPAGIWFGNSFNSNNNVSLQLRTSNDGTSVQAMTITSGGNVAIGNTHVNVARLEVTGPIPTFFTADSSANSATYGGSIFYRTTNTVNNGNGITFSLNDSLSSRAEYAYIGGLIETNTNGSHNGAIIFAPSRNGNRTESMRITSGGNLSFSGGCNIVMSTTSYIQAYTSTGNNYGIAVQNTSNNTSAKAIRFQGWDASETGNISTYVNLTTYNTTSDYRLKEDLKEFNGLDLVSRLKMYDFKWKAADWRMYGALAHEVKEVLPYAVSGEKDGEDMQSLDYSTLVPLLVKSIQELKTQNDSLQSQINELKAQ